MTAPLDPLDRALALVRSLRPDWRDGETFYQRRSEALALLRQAAFDRCAACPRRHAVPTRSRPDAPRAAPGGPPRAHDGVNDVEANP